MASFAERLDVLCKEYTEDAKNIILEYIEEFKKTLIVYCKFEKDENVDIKIRKASCKLIKDLREHVYGFDIDKCDEELISAYLYQIQHCSDVANLICDSSSRVISGIAKKLDEIDKVKLNTFVEGLKVMKRDILISKQYVDFKHKMKDDVNDKSDEKDEKEKGEKTNAFKDLISCNLKTIKYLKQFDSDASDFIEFMDMFYHEDDPGNGSFRFHTRSYQDEFHLPCVLLKFMKSFDNFDGLHLNVNINDVKDKLS
jgi:hypothetical protein